MFRGRDGQIQSNWILYVLEALSVWEDLRMLLRREKSLGGKITNPENSAWFVCSLIQLPKKPLLGTHYELDIMPVASATKTNNSPTVFFFF